MDTLIFDVNETLLDLSVLQPHIQQYFGKVEVMKEWFSELIRQSMIATLTDRYEPFDKLAADALNMVAMRYRFTLGAQERAKIAEQMHRLPPHPEVPVALSRLKKAGYTMVALTNSPQLMMTNQLVNAGLAGYFDKMLSVDAVKKFKPHSAVYQYAAQQIGRPIQQCRMIAAHDWDITGAMRAGMKGAFVARPGKVLGEMGAKPDIIASDLTGVANHLLSA